MHWNLRSFGKHIQMCSSWWVRELGRLWISDLLQLSHFRRPRKFPGAQRLWASSFLWGQPPPRSPPRDLAETDLFSVLRCCLFQSVTYWTCIVCALWKLSSFIYRDMYGFHPPCMSHPVIPFNCWVVSILWMAGSLFIHLTVEGHLGCFQCLAILKKIFYEHLCSD